MRNRRHFLRSLALVGTVVALRPLAAWAQGSASANTSGVASSPAPAATPLSHAAFVGALGSAFAMDGGEQLVLDKVSEAVRCPATESFSVWLRGGAELLPAAGTYAFHHAAMGRFTMFVVPKDLADGSRGCEAVFNRLV